MGGHGGLNILPQKSWNVYGQRNRQKVAEDEEAHREKEEADQKQRSKGDRQLRLQVLRRQAGEPDDDQADLEESQDVHDGPVFEERPAERAPTQHINFWSSFEKSARNPEREAEKKQTARKRGDPKTQTSDARFDERFAVMHGLSGQAPWYARPQQALYATEAGPAADAGPAVNHAAASTSRQPHYGGSQLCVESRGRREQHRNGERQSKDAAQHDSFNVVSARSDLAAMVGQVNASHNMCSESGAKDDAKLKHYSKYKHKSKWSGDSEGKAKGHRKRERAERSRSPKRSKSKRRDRHSSSSSGGDDRGAARRSGSQKTPVVAQSQSTSSKDKFEHLRRERLERERSEAQRTRALLQQHFSR